MTVLDTATPDALSDDAAVSRLFELTAQAGTDAAELRRVEALVYQRLLQAYEADELPVLQGRTL